jgi:NAD(P)-dependent dehydrogenase (short-subunit alcohol dehydrogenase family)
MNTTLPAADAHTANVTGASRGIGGAIAQRFAADGGVVVMSIVADQNRTARLRRVRSGDLLASRDYVHVRAEVSDVA